MATWGRAQGRLIRIAHRGASGTCPENTLRAFAAALDLGVDAVELDCQLTADGALAVIHDETLDRTTDGLGPVGARTWAEIARLDAGLWKGERHRGARVPRLADVLDLVAGRALVNVEIKSRRDVGRIETPLVELVRAAGAAEWVVFSSFHHRAVQAVRAGAPWARLAILCNAGPAAGALALAAEVAAGCIAPRHTLVDAALVAAAHARDLGVWVWTVNEPADVRRLQALGVDAIFSDYPERFGALAPPA
jgi:glycerophosphoryl diester phosphodiesterase